MDVDRRAQADIFDEKTIPAIAEVERIAKVSAVKGNADHNELSADLKQGEETGVMLKVYTSSDLGSRYHEISAALHASEEPIFITEDGEVDAVMLSIEAYERLTARLELYEKVEQGLRNIEAGRVLPAREALDAIRRDLHNGTL